MARNRPTIERRSPIEQATVVRTAHTGKQLAKLVMVFSIAVGVIYFATRHLPTTLSQLHLPPVLESLLATMRSEPAAPPTPAAKRQAKAIDVLHAAIRSADLPRVDAALSRLSSEELDQAVNGMTALMWAASTGNAKVTRALLAHGANPNARGAHQRTALQYAAEKNRLRVAEWLLDAGADINGVDNGSLTPLIMAADRNFTQLALLLIRRGANVNIQNIEGWTALMDAAEAGNVELVQALLAAGARKEARHRNGSTALDFAQQGHHQEIVRLLSRHTAAISTRGSTSQPTTSSSALERPLLPDEKGQTQ